MRVSSRSIARCGCSRRWPPPSAPSSALELAQRCGVNRSTAWRLLATLEAHGLVERDAATGRYVVGYAAFQLATAEDHDALARRLRPLLARTAEATGEIVTLAMVKRFGLVYVDQADPPGPPSPNWNGRQIPLHATSSGKVFLAWLPEDERAAVLPATLERYTPHTIVDRGELDRELERVRRDGYSTCLGRVRLLERRLGGGVRRQSPADRDRQHLGPQPARDAHAAARARARRPARGPRDVAAAGMSDAELAAPVGLLGGGVIGGGWAARFLLAGIDVRLYDPDPEAERKLGEMLENARRALTRLSARARCRARAR